MRGMYRWAAIAMAVWAPLTHAGFKVAVPTAPPVVPAAQAPKEAPLRPGFQSIDALARTPPARGASDEPPAAAPGFGFVAVTYVGTPPPLIDTREGAGRDVTLSQALEQIAPAQWHAFGSADTAPLFSASRRVSWKGGRAWTAVLDILANDLDITIEVDWEHQRLYVGRQAPAKAADTPGSVTAAKAAKAPPVAPVVARREWRVAAGSTFRTTISQWAEQERPKWIVVWPMDDLDYRIVAPLVFDGATLADAARKFTILYEGAERPLWLDVKPSQHLLVFAEGKKR